jgi:hypothetical protein
VVFRDELRYFSRVKSIVWMSERGARALGDLLSSETVAVTSPRQFLEARRDAKTVSFVDGSTIAQLDEAVAAVDLPIGQVEPVIAICGEPLHAAIGWLSARPWLSHVVSSSMLQHPMSVQHFGNVMLTLTSGNHPRLLDWVGPTLSGRRVRLSQSSSRAQRLERMAEFFDSKGVGSRTVELLRDAGEELLTNAFYDAPVEAGALKQAISRTQEVQLPDDSACDMVYACHDDLAVVRVRDPFGSLTRSRLVEVLTRCARTDMAVEVDETRGGAGLGLWRIFSSASFVGIAVVRGRYTEFLVGIAKRVSAAPRPFAIHLFFREHGKTARRWRLLDADSTKPSVNESVTIVTK